MKNAIDSLRGGLAVLRAQIEIAKGNWNRFPAGSTKGGQFAPKGQSGGGSFSALAAFLNATGSGQPKETPKGAAQHPKKGEKGENVRIDHPSKPSGKETWRDKAATATFVPGGDVPKALHGVELRPWKAPTTTEGWAKVSGQNPKLDERLPFIPSPGKSVGAGVVIMEPDGRVWLTKPTNEFGGYKHTFPKGTAEPGLSLQANAIKEAWEESGLKVQIVGVLGDFERTTSKARFYLARRVGGTPADMGWESQAMRLAPLKNANSLLNMGVDRSIISNIKGIKIAKTGWQKQPRWPSGSALGGQWKSYDSEGLPLPPKVGSATNAAYAKAADAAYSAAKAGDVQAAFDAAYKYSKAAAAYNVAAGKGVTYHVKEGAKVHQYVVDLMAAYGAKLDAGVKPDASDGPAKLSSMTSAGGKPGGSNPGGLYKDASGAQYLVKGNAQLVNGNVTQAVSDDRAKNEVLASKLMQAAGVGAPDMKLVDLQGSYGGGLGVASKWMQGQDFDPSNPAHLAAAQKDFAVHAWLANHDVVGLSNDNLKMVDGKAVNIDPGGAILFRAQGLPKTGFGTDVTELKGMRDPAINPAAAKVYASMTKGQIKDSAKALAQVTDDQIKAMVDAHGPGDAAAKAKLAQILIARKQAIFGYAGLKADGTEPAPAPTVGNVAPAPKPVAAPAAPAAAPAAPTPTVAAPQMSVLTNTYDGSNKFWAVGVSGSTLVTHYGKINATGSVTVKQYGSSKEASEAAAKLMQSKYKKGYVWSKVTDAPSTVKQALGVKAAPAAAAPAPAKPAPQPPAAPAPQGSSAGKMPLPPTINGKNPLMQTVADLIHAEADKGIAPVITKIPAQGGQIGKTQIQIGRKVATLANPPKTADGKALLAYAQQAIAHAANVQAASDAAAVTTAQSAMQAVAQKPAVAHPPAPGTSAGNGLPAMPDFAKAKLPAGNSNAPSHNAKVDKIADLAAKGDVQGLLAQGYGSNTYGKQQAKLANSALAAMGVTATVAAGQKANTHPAINGGIAPDKAAAALANAGSPAAPSVTAPASKGVKLKVDPSLLPAKTDYKGANGGKGLSSSAAVNQQNDDLQRQIETLAKAGDLAGLQSMTFATIDKATGSPTGKVAGISSHPSKNITAYWNDSVSLLRDLASGPPQPLKVVDVTAAKSVADISAHFPAKKAGSTVGKAKSNEKFGFWLALGSVTNPAVVQPKKTQAVSKTAITEAKAKYHALSNDAKTFISSMQATGAFADAYRNGQTHYGSLDLAKLAKAAKEAAVELDEGTTVYRWQNMPQSMLTQLAQAEPGLVFQATGPMPTSYSETATAGFGTHRLKIRYAKGAKAVMSFSSGGFSSEKEITTLPNARFVLLKKEQVPDTEHGKGHQKRWEIEVLMLPPD